MWFNLIVNSNMYAEGIIDTICEEHLWPLPGIYSSLSNVPSYSSQFSMDAADLYV